MAALVACLAVSAWALLTLLAAGGPTSATDLGPAAGSAALSPVAAPSPTQDASAAPTANPRGSAVPRPATRPAGLAELDRARAEAAAAIPVRLTVDAVGIRTPVDPVGVHDDGQMEIPENASRAGWYRFGPAPGAAGSAVVAGHVDDALGRAGSLAALHDVELGDEVVVEHADGRRTTYLVESRTSVAKEELAVDRLFAREGEPRLVLVTCTGAWSRAQGQYEENLVVVARPSGR